MDIFRTLRLHPYWHHIFVTVPTKHISSFLSFLPIRRGTVVLTLAGHRLELPSRRMAFESILVHFYLHVVHGLFAISFVPLTLALLCIILLGQWIVILTDVRQYENPFISTVLHFIWDKVCDIVLKGGFTLNMYILTS